MVASSANPEAVTKFLAADEIATWRTLSSPVVGELVRVRDVMSMPYKPSAGDRRRRGDGSTVAADRGQAR
jgi:hypothetical protein